MIITNEELHKLGPGLTVALGEWLESIMTLFDSLHAASPARLSATPVGTLRSYATRLRALGEALGKELDRRGELKIDKNLETQLETRASKARNAGDWTETSQRLSDSIDAVTVYVGVIPMFLRQTPDSLVVALNKRVHELLTSIHLTDEPDDGNVELRVNQRSDQVKASIRNRLRLLGV